VRLVAVAVALALCTLTACGGSKKPSAYARANTALLATLPVYPGAAAPKTSAGVSSNTEFGGRDWTLPAETSATAVVDWYIPRLQKAGWRITGKNVGTIRAVRHSATLVVGVRGRTLEILANSRGA
jgi:hypothetical protein